MIFVAAGTGEALSPPIMELLPRDEALDTS